MATNISGTLGVDKIDPALIASTAEAQAGTDNTKLMTPLRVADVALGVGQTWQDVTSSRVFGTTYTNTTGKPIFVSGRTSNFTSSTTVTCVVDGVTAFQRSAAPAGASENIAFTFIVPNGSTYSVSGGSLGYWSELR
jgi:hypothetical protein